MKLTKRVSRILHFVLFVFACIAVHRWRREREFSVTQLLTRLRKLDSKVTTVPPPATSDKVHTVRLAEDISGVHKALVFYVTDDVQDVGVDGKAQWVDVGKGISQ
jgi:hypothetical protein